MSLTGGVPSEYPDWLQPLATAAAAQNTDDFGTGVPQEYPDWLQRWFVRDAWEVLPPAERAEIETEFPYVQMWMAGIPPEDWMAPQKDNRNWFQKHVIGNIMDWGGNVWGTSLDVLEVPSDWTERVLGYPLTYIYWNNVPDGYSRGELAQLTWDVSLSYIGGGFDEPRKKAERIEQGMLQGVPFESIMDQNQGWQDIIGKIALDPLWLIGGTGVLSKAPGGLARLIPGGKAALRAIGFAGGKGGPAALRAVKNADEAYKAWDTAFRASRGIESGTRVKKAAAAWEVYQDALKAVDTTKMGMLGKVIEYGIIGGGEAPINLWKSAAYNKLVTLPGGIGRSARIARGVLGPKPVEQAMWDVVQRHMASAEARAAVIRTGNPRGPFAPIINRLFKVKPEFQASELKKSVESLFIELINDPKFTRDEMALFIDAMSEGREGVRALPRSIRDKVPLQYVEGGLSDEIIRFFSGAMDSPKITAKSFPSLANTKLDDTQFVTEFFGDTRNLEDSIRQAFGVTGSKTAPEKWLGWYKTGLSTTTLNSPAFVVLNAVNNMATNFADYGIDMFRGGLTRRGMERALASEGVSPHIIPLIIDQSIYRQMFGVTSGQLGLRKIAAPFVALASELDAWSRIKAWQVGRTRGMRSAAAFAIGRPAFYHTLAPDMRVTFDAFIDNIGVSGYAALDNMEEAVRAGYTPNFGNVLGREFAMERLPQHFTEDTPPEIWGHFLEPIDETMQSLTGAHRLEVEGAEKVVSRLEYQYIRHTDEIRNANSLQPIALPPELTQTPGITEGLNAVAEDAMGRARVDLVFRHLGAQGIPKKDLDATLEPLRNVFKNAKQRREALRTITTATEADLAAGVVSRTDWEHMKKVGPHALWKDYESWRLAEFDAAYDKLLERVTYWSPNLAETYQHVRRTHLANLRQHDSLRDLAFRRKEDWRLVGGEPMGDLRRQVDDLFNESTKELEQVLGLHTTKQYMYPAADAMPSTVEAITMSNNLNLEFLNWARPRLLAEIHQPRGVPLEHVDEALEWVRAARGKYKDIQLVGNRVGHASADWTMLNYGAYGNMDSWMMWVFPYHFWPMRSMWRWSQRFMANPGLASVLAKTRDLQHDINKDLPEYMKGNFRIPVPFLGDKMQEQFGVEMDMFFDPLNIMFPALAWSEDFSFESRQGTTAGRILDWMGNNGPGVSPFVPLIGSKLGLLEEEEWLTRGWPRSLPFGIPGTPAQMGIIAWLEGDDRIDIDSFLSEEEQIQLLKGSGLPLAAIQRTLGMEDDEVDRYRIDRGMVDLLLTELSNISDQEERDALVNEYLHAMDDPDHPLWKRARDFASKEYGTQSLISWLFAPVMLYPKSRYQVSALKGVHDQYAEQDNLEEFYERFPEYQLRNVAVRNFDSKEERDKELHRALFNIDIAEAEAVLEQDQQEYNSVMTQLNADPKFFDSKMGRWYYDMVREEYGSRIRQDKELVNQIWGMYGYAFDIPSYRYTPRERGLRILSEQYYNIQLEDYLPKGKDLETASDDEIFAALDRMGDARDEFIAGLPSRRVDSKTSLKDLVRYYAAAEQARVEAVRLGKEEKWDERDTLWENTRALQDEITDHTMGLISRSEFVMWLERNQEPPSQWQVAWQEAEEQMGIYMATGPDDLNWPKELRRQYWAEHPLLERFFGNEPSPYEDALPTYIWEAYARLMQLRDLYNDKPGMRQLDFLSGISDELNALLTLLGLPTVDLEMTRTGRWDLRLPGIGVPPLEEVEAYLQ